MKLLILNLAKLISLLTVPIWFGLTIIASYQTSWAFSSSTILSLSTLFSLLFLSLNQWIVPGGCAWKNYYGGKKLIKIRGPIGWPLLGSLPEMGSSLAHRKLAHLAASLGTKRLMALSLGPTRVVISSHPETAKEILAGSSFSDRPIKESARLLMFERAIGFAPAATGTHWRHLRRIAAVHMFSPRTVAGLESIRRRVADKMLALVGVEMEEKGVVGLRGTLQEGSLTNILECVFGSCISCRFGELGHMVKEGYELISTFNLEDYFPQSFLDFHGVKRRCHKLAAKVNTVVGQIVKDRKIRGTKETDPENNSSSNNHDFLSALLSLPKEDQLSDSDMVAILWELIFRGTDTVAILLEWVMARMVLHQEIQAKVQQEIDTCVGNNRHVRDSDIPNLPYLRAVVKEVLRLHPPGPLLSWARLAVHDVYVDNVFIPAGTTAMVNMWAITHDRSIWKDPWAFKPDRFIEEDVSIMGSDLRLAPFGSGRRVCPGKALGLATVHLWLARLLQQYTWLPAQPVDLSESLRLSMEMNKPLLCHVVRRCNIASS